MPVKFDNNPADSGAADPTSVLPVVAGETVGPTVTNRSTEVLRNRTETLKIQTELLERLVREDFVVAPTGGRIVWTGVYDPGNAAVDSTTGMAYTGAGVGQLSGSLVVYPVRSGVTAHPASAQLGGVYFAISGMSAALGANNMRVVFNTQTWPTGGGSATVFARFERPNTSVTPTTTGAAPSGTEDTLAVYAKSGATVNDVVTVVNALPNSAGGADITATALVAGTTLIPTGVHTANFGGAVDATCWNITPSALQTFYLTGQIDRQATACALVSSGVYDLTIDTSVYAMPTFYPGMVLDVSDVPGSGTYVPALDQATVVSVDTAAHKVRVKLSSNRTRTPFYVRYIPNRLRAGDTLVAVVGDPNAWPSSTLQLQASDLRIARTTLAAWPSTVVPLFTVPPGSTQLLWNGQLIEAGNVYPDPMVGYVKLGGDLQGDVNAVSVVAATSAHAGAVKVNVNVGAPNTVPALDANGVALATGIARPAAGQLAVGTSTNDTSIALGRAAAPLTINSPVTTASDFTFGAPPTFPASGTMTVGPDTTFNNNVKPIKDVIFSGTGTQQIVKTGGDLNVGTVGGNVYLFAGSDANWQWQLDSTGSLTSRGGKITGLPKATADSDAANKKLVVDGDAATLAAANSYSLLTTLPAAKDYTNTQVNSGARYVVENTIQRQSLWIRIDATGTLSSSVYGPTYASAGTKPTGLQVQVLASGYTQDWGVRRIIYPGIAAAMVQVTAETPYNNVPYNFTQDGTLNVTNTTLFIPRIGYMTLGDPNLTVSSDATRLYSGPDVIYVGVVTVKYDTNYTSLRYATCPLHVHAIWG